MTKKIYQGLLNIRSESEADDILFLNYDDNPLSDIIQDDIKEYGNYLTIRYFISDLRMTEEQLIDNLIRTLSGDSEAVFGHAYSEYTGYLWTDELIMVGGHDLLSELKEKVGKWLWLEINYSKVSQNEKSNKTSI